MPSSTFQVFASITSSSPFDTLVRELRDRKDHLEEKEFFKIFKQIDSEGTSLDQKQLKLLIDLCTRQLRGFLIIEHLLKNEKKYNGLT